MGAAGRRSGGLDDVLDDLPGHGLVAVLAHGATPVAELEELLGALDHLLLQMQGQDTFRYVG